MSVVIPSRNRSERLRVAVASALEQTHPPLEVVIVDDASTDDTPAVVAGLAEAAPQVRSVRLKERGGAQAARNRGVRESRGEWVAFLDDDCMWEPTKLEKQLSALGPGRGLAYCRHAIHDGDQWIIEGEPGAARVGAAGLLRKNYIGTYTILVRKDILDAVGAFDEGMPRLQDWDLLLRLCRHTRFAYVPEILVRGEMLATGITMDRPALATAAQRMVEKHEPHLTRRQRAALNYGLGKYLLVDGLTAMARTFFARALRLDPLTAAHWAGAAAVLFGPAPAKWVRSLRRLRRSAGEDLGP